MSFTIYIVRYKCSLFPNEMTMERHARLNTVSASLQTYRRRLQPGFCALSTDAGSACCSQLFDLIASFDASLLPSPFPLLGWTGKLEG